MNLRSPYIFCYSRFLDIFQRLIPPDRLTNSNKILIFTSLHGFPGQSKDKIDKELIIQAYSDLISNYKNNNFNVLGTDASISPELQKCGIAVVDDYSNISLRFMVTEMLSSQSAELLAIEQAIQFGIDGNYCKIVIFTDSKTSCQILLKKPDNNCIVAKIINTIESCDNLLEVHLVWTPGHVGIQLNEDADKEAKCAIDEGVELFPPLTPNEALNKIKTRLIT